MLHGIQQNLEAIRQDSEGIFNHPPCAGLYLNILSSLSRPLWLYDFIMVSRRAKASSPKKK